MYMLYQNVYRELSQLPLRQLSAEKGPVLIKPTDRVGSLVPSMMNITRFRIKPLALTNGHGRYMAVTPERALASVGDVR
jgi:hypothetical protein